eukprot:GHVS01100769.1.p1 GENE.GHVS01100769.1~~GHVS01100769.1.p1  ORF type:complete len:465 (+),score=76.91 GHVS01100769.1:202-1395(+)
MEARIVVWSLAGMSVFKDVRRRNDVAVEITMRWVDFESRVHSDTQRTDIHKFAQYRANYNFRMVFAVTLPAFHVRLSCKLVDVDSATSEQQIYAPECLELDHVCQTTLDRLRIGDDVLPATEVLVRFSPPKGKKLDFGQMGACLRMTWCIIREFVVCCCVDLLPSEEFYEDSGDADADVPILEAHQLTDKKKPTRYEAPKQQRYTIFCRKCWFRLGCHRCRRPPLNRAATLSLQVQLLPKALALKNPVGLGREEPNRDPFLAAPGGRIGWKMLFKSPMHFLRILIGPDNMNCLKFCCCSICLITFIAFIVMVIAQIVMATSAATAVPAAPLLSLGENVATPPDEEEGGEGQTGRGGGGGGVGRRSLLSTLGRAIMTFMSDDDTTTTTTMESSEWLWQ